MNKRQQLTQRYVAKTIQAIRIKHYSYETEKCYVGWVRRYIAAIWEMPNSLPSEQKVERFLGELAVVQDVASSTQNQAFNAIIFFYKVVLGVELKNIDALRAKRPSQIRVAPPPHETQALLLTVRDVGGYPCNLVVSMLYGCGLRMSEALSIRLKDIRIEESKLFIMHGKGGKDRVVRLPCALVSRIEHQIKIAQQVWARDCKASIPIRLPHQLGKCRPELEYAWQWAWLFPLHNPCKDPRDGRIVRWHMLPDSVQRAVKYARRKLGILVVPHQLRHAYATDNLKRGVSMKALQVAMGHKYIETTSAYCHDDAMSVPSPLDPMVENLHVLAPSRTRGLLQVINEKSKGLICQ